ncbi:MAG: ATP-binding protein [Pirellulales bacterium]
MPRTPSQWAALVVSGVAIAAGALALVGWRLDIVALKSVLPGMIAMNPLTAVAFVGCGVSLWLLSADPCRVRRRWPACAIAIAVAMAAAIRLSAYATGFDAGLDCLLFRDALGDNRMAPNTALAFLLVSCALATLDWKARRGYLPTQALTLLAGGVALVSLVGYSYGAQPLYQVGTYIPMAVNTAAVFLALSVGLLCARPRRGFAALISQPGPGGMVARRLTPAAIGIPCALGWLRILGQRAGLFETEIGAALMVVATVVMFLAAIGWIAAALNRSDDERKRAELAVRQFNAQLEKRVAERTADLAAANHDLLQKNQENEMFVYSVSHDLRSPLVNLQGFSKELGLVCQEIQELLRAHGTEGTELSQRGRQLEEDMQRSVRFIQTAVMRLSGIIDALLRLSRAGRVEYQQCRIDVRAAVDRVVESMAGTIFDRGASVRVYDLPPTVGDPTAIEQVFANLVGNALNYLDPKRPGLIEVGSTDAAGGTDANNELSPRLRTYFVRDNGLGIAEAYHSKVFQALKRLHPEVAKGEGIGLAIVRRIVHRHGGKAWFESKAGQGSTFFIELPVVENEACSTAPAKAVEAPRESAARS